MSILIIVNIISSLAILIGGLCMKKYAVSHADYSIGYRSARAMSGEDAWRFANHTCGIAWIISGIATFILTIAALLFIRNDRVLCAVQIAVLILLCVSVIITAAAIEHKLRTCPHRDS